MNKLNPIRICSESITLLSGRRLGITSGIPLILLLLCSCESVNYDMRQLHQPVVLNSNPMLVSGKASPIQWVDVDHYTANVSQAQITASSGNGYATTTTSQRSTANEAQVNAFNKIGGQPNRGIRNVSLEANFLAVNGLFVLADSVSVQANGDVIELRTPPPANVPTPAAPAAVPSAHARAPLAEAAVSIPDPAVSTNQVEAPPARSAVPVTTTVVSINDNSVAATNTDVTMTTTNTPPSSGETKP